MAVQLVPIFSGVNMNVNPDFLRRLKNAFEKLGIVRAEINDALRPNGFRYSFHTWGQAVDIHSVQYKNGKKIYFHALSSGYNADSDTAFYWALKSRLGNLLQEYISPAIVKTSGNRERNNKYRKSSRGEIQQALGKKSAAGKYDEDIWHLDHLHLAVAERLTLKQKAAVGGGILLIAAAGGWYWYKNQGKI